MVQCKVCSKLNSLDSKFCRECGERLPEEEVREAEEANAKLIGEGQKLLAEGRVDEAAMVAEEAIAHNPNDVVALALLGDCREREGRVEDALEAYERIVEISPESPLDRIRVAHLRKTLTAQATALKNPNARRNAILGAIAAGAVIIAVGTAFVLASENGANQAAGNREARVASNEPPTHTVVPTPGGDPNQATPSAQPAENAQAADGGEERRPSNPAPDLPLAPLPRRSGPLPNVEPGNPFQPLNPNPGNIGVEPTADPNPIHVPPAGSSNDPKPVAEPSEPPKEAPRPAVIDIRPSRNQTIRRGGSDVVPEASSGQLADNLLRIARQRFLTGNFSQAADAYERALRAGADAGSTNQRLGQCYVSLGRRSEAASAYQRALNAFQRSGGGGRTRAAIESCKAALRQLQGS